MTHYSDNLPYAYCEQIGKEIRDISDEIPFDIPDTWEWVRFSSVIELQSGQDLTPDKYNANEKGLPYITGASNIENGEVIINRWTEFCRAFALKGDILLTCKGTVGTMAILQEEKVHIARQIMGIRPYNGIDTDYVRLVLETLVESLKAAAKSMIPGIARDDVLFSFIPIPPLAEQHRIVSKIEELLPYIDKYGKAEEHLTALNTTFPEALKKSILQEAVQGKLVPQNPDDEPARVLLQRIRAEKQALIKAGKIKKDKHESVIVTRDKIPYEIIDEKERCIADEVPFELPESWCWCRLKSIINAVSARRVHQSDWKNSGIPFYRAREIAKLAENGYVDNELFISEELFAEYAQSGVPKSGDLMVTAVGTLGKTYIVRDTDKFYYKDASVICFENYGKLSSEYLRYLMMSPYMETVIKDNSSGTTVGTITLVRANEYLIPLPPLAEQKRIVEKIKELMQYCDKL